jgi:Predicted methyltransferase
MKRQCIKVPKKKGETVRRMLLELELLDNSVKISTGEAFLYLPLTREPAPDER